MPMATRFMPSVRETAQAKIRDAADKREFVIAAQMLCHAAGLQAGTEVLRAFVISSILHGEPLDGDLHSLGEVLRESLHALRNSISEETRMVVVRSIRRVGGWSGPLGEGFDAPAWSPAKIEEIKRAAKTFGR